MASPGQQQEGRCQPLFGSIGTLTHDAVEDTVQCHVCGDWFRGLGHHIRVHDLTAVDYRSAFGLYRTRALSGPGLVRAQSERQRARYLKSPEVRGHLAPGQAMATGGQLWWRARVASVGRRPPPQLVAGRRRMLAAGRARQVASAEVRLEQRLATLGFQEPKEYFRNRCVAGQTSQDDLRSELGVGRDRLRRLLDDNGVQRRPTGRNTLEGKRSRARRGDVEAARRLGVVDIRCYIAERVADGWTVHRIAGVVGHSDPWVRARMDRTLAPHELPVEGTAR